MVWAPPSPGQAQGLCAAGSSKRLQGRSSFKRLLQYKSRALRFATSPAADLRGANRQVVPEASQRLPGAGRSAPVRLAAGRQRAHATRPRGATMGPGGAASRGGTKKSKAQPTHTVRAGRPLARPWPGLNAGRRRQRRAALKAQMGKKQNCRSHNALCSKKNASACQRATESPARRSGRGVQPASTRTAGKEQGGCATRGQG